VEGAKLTLGDAGLSIITEIDVRETFKRKLNADSRNYRILGACNPAMAREALEIEDKIGTMLPCNVVVQDMGDGRVDVSAVDPVESMAAVGNPTLLQGAGPRALKCAVETSERNDCAI
jgi:uncharacterized protein (DUF302 family)